MDSYRRRTQLLRVTILGLAMFAVRPTSAAPVAFSVGSVAAKPDSAVVVPIQVQGAKALGALQFELTFDAAALRYESLEPGSFPQELTTGANLIAPGVLRVVANTAPADSVSGDGKLVGVKFTVLSAAPSQLELRLERLRAWDNTKPDAVPYEMLTTTQPGTLLVKSPVDWRMWGVAIAIILAALLLLLRKR